MATAFINNEELWRECASWLTRLDVLRNDHRVNFDDATIVDLANTLRDGVVLCTLLSKIDPTCIDMKDVNLKPVMAQFLCLKNIQLFLDKCNSTFSLKDSDLFDPLMLFDLTNFYVVLCTLSKLSLTQKARKAAEGFSVQSAKTKEEEDIYQSLKTVEPPRNAIESNEYAQYPEYDYYQYREDIYQDLCTLPSGFASELTSTQPAFEKRDFVIRELVDTEKNYVDVLCKLRKNFMNPLQHFIKPEIHGIIFYKINELYEIHSRFLNLLNKTYTDKNTKLSKVFMQCRESFLVYGEYCANLSNACNILQDVCNRDDIINEAVIRFEKEDNNGKFKLRDVLSVPMQRILKYHLLLDNLIKSTDPNHDEFNELKRAREGMLDVAGYINETAGDLAHLNVIKKLKNDITGWEYPIALESLGRLLKDGEVKVKAHNDNKIRNRYVFIFNKCMIICKQVKGGQFAYRDMLYLSQFTIDDYHDRPLLNSNIKWTYQFHLVKSDQSVVYTLNVRSRELKGMMVKALREAMDNLKPLTLSKTTHKFEMHTFSEPTTCYKCSKYLKGCIYQGYQCTTCQIAVHKECISTAGRCTKNKLTTETKALPPTPSSIKDKLWFADNMDRNEATRNLMQKQKGTFLVRYRSNSDEPDPLALSLKTDSEVKHMKIRSNVNGSEKKYYLSLSKYFNSVEELIENYQFNSLKENFDRLEEDTKLEWPYKQILAVSKRDFNPQESNQLYLQVGDQITILDLSGYREGWWKGKIGSGIGYFPAEFVEIVHSDL